MLNTLINRKNAQITRAAKISLTVKLSETPQNLRVSVAIAKNLFQTVFAWSQQFIFCNFLANVIQIEGCLFP